ncbi:hypothetical protein C4D60_Mb04t21920 [Musa balbisiana]|uniref:PPPDE domain-containing protein n=1 Tax=Musa balbisiana TaxID=52838 RepID=A0A4S8KDU2_MUSBA|nr:hypothetical protein C4D60_Mb04t21920 [Musa balbisiana]
MSNRVNMVSRSSLTKSVSNGDKDGSGRTHLYLNVYDLTPVNKYLYWFGLGVFHSGIEGGSPYPRVETLLPPPSSPEAKQRSRSETHLGLADVGIPSTVLEKSSCGASLWEHRTYDHLLLHLPKQFGELPLLGFPEVHGMEYGFGAHEYPTSGVFEVEPKSCPGFIFRRSVWLGTTDMSRSEFRLFIEDLAGKYHGDTYHLIIKNCNHFTDEVCMRLTGKPIPGWVNRLARLGSFCNCILPGNIRVSTVGQLPTHPACSDDESDLFAWSSADESDEEDADCHPLKKPNIDFVHSIDEPLRLARDVM